MHNGKVGPLGTTDRCAACSGGCGAPPAPTSIAAWSTALRCEPRALCRMDAMWAWISRRSPCSRPDRAQGTLCRGLLRRILQPLPTVAARSARRFPATHPCRAELDEDLPAHGQHYCIACARYFISPLALEDHEKTKPHRR